jgi:hypothetical protein
VQALMALAKVKCLGKICSCITIGITIGASIAVAISIA